VKASASDCLLSIGEFAAATQLSPKALRLYDEQRLLQPATTDPINCYRYYRSDQVMRGRLVRTLRDMGLPLADVKRVLDAGPMQAEVVLSQCARELDQRYAREKRAYQRSLLLLRHAANSDAVTVEGRVRPTMTVVVVPFTARRRKFYERWREKLEEVRVALERVPLVRSGETCCRMIEPLSDEEAQLELLVPVESPSRLPNDLTLRHLRETHCACITVNGALDAQSGELSGALDAIFDWFDRHGSRAVDVPWISRVDREGVLRTELSWEYQT